MDKLQRCNKEGLDQVERCGIHICIWRTDHCYCLGCKKCEILRLRIVDDLRRQVKSVE